jgi:hypothetical protein
MRTALERVERLAAAARASQDLADADREARDQAIEEADLEGASRREISRAAQLSSTQVQAVVLRRTAERQDRLARAAGLS